MKRVIVGILSICIIAATITTMYVVNSKADSKQINKTFTGFIFSSEGKLVKEVPIKINGKQYSENHAYRDYFTGTIEIDGKLTEISSTKNKDEIISNFDTQKFYLAVNPVPENVNRYVVHTTTITISKDFTTAYGVTPNLRNNYGQMEFFFKTDRDLKTPIDENIQYVDEAAKKVKLYVSAMKLAFQAKNAGNGFIAVKEETLEGFEEEKSKQDILEGLRSLSRNVYWYEGVKQDISLFEFDNNGRMTRTLNGTLLSIKVEEFKGDEAVIEATSCVDNTGAVSRKYKATYKDGQWLLQ
jgi:hypothetical protein